MTISDLSAFVVIFRNLGTSPGDTHYSKRHDLSPGPGPLTTWINVLDMSALIAGPTEYPPMFGGVRAFNGPVCTGP